MTTTQGASAERCKCGMTFRDCVVTSCANGADTGFRLAPPAAMLAASPQVEVAPPQTEQLTPLDYRAQGREEVLAIILAESPECPFDDCLGWSNPVGPDDEGGMYWKEIELRAKLHIGDAKHDAYDRAEAAYWDAQGCKDEAEREMLFVKQAPFYQPLHDFLAKHEAWDLMGDLKRAGAAQVEVAPQAEQVANLDPNQVQTVADRIRNTAGLATPERAAAPVEHAEGADKRDAEWAGKEEIQWGHDLQVRLLAASQDVTESDEARNVMTEAACLLASLTGRAARQASAPTGDSAGRAESGME